MRPEPRRESDPLQNGLSLEASWGNTPQSEPPTDPQWEPWEPPTEPEYDPPTEELAGPPTDPTWEEAPAEPPAPHESGLYYPRPRAPDTVSPESVQLSIRPEVERRLDGIMIHVHLSNRASPDRTLTFSWTSGPYATGDQARDALVSMLRTRLQSAAGAWIEVNGLCYPNVASALAAFWPAQH